MSTISVNSDSNLGLQFPGLNKRLLRNSLLPNVCRPIPAPHLLSQRPTSQKCSRAFTSPTGFASMCCTQHRALLLGKCWLRFSKSRLGRLSPKPFRGVFTAPPPPPQAAGNLFLWTESVQKPKSPRLSELVQRLFFAVNCCQMQSN